jgi:hypothetical protein
MNLTEAQLAKAKQEAKELLEYSIGVLCMTLGVDVSTINDSYDHDFVEGHSEYAAHESLKRQVANYVLISGY